MAPQVKGEGLRSGGRREALERRAAIPEQDERVIVATGRYLGEGFDDQRLDTLFLTMPITLRGTLALLVGGDKSGVSSGRFYKGVIKRADARFDQHLEALK